MYQPLIAEFTDVTDPDMIERIEDEMRAMNHGVLDDLDRHEFKVLAEIAFGLVTKVPA